MVSDFGDAQVMAVKSPRKMGKLVVNQSIPSIPIYYPVVRRELGAMVISCYIHVTPG